MGSRFYFRFFLFLFASFFLLFALGWLSSQKTQIKQKKELLKARLKWEASHQIDFLDRKLAPFNSFIDKISAEIEQKGISFQSPKQTSDRPYLLFDDLEKDDSEKRFAKSAKTSSKEAVKSQLEPSIEKLFLKLFIFDKRDLKLPLYSKTVEEPELFKALDLENKPFLKQVLSPNQPSNQILKQTSNQSSKQVPNQPPKQIYSQTPKQIHNQTYFEKFKWKGKTYPLLFQVKGSQIFVVFLKKSYFRLDPFQSNRKDHTKTQNNKLENQSQSQSESRLKSQSQLAIQTPTQIKTPPKILFSTFDKNQNLFFYNTNLRNSPKLINAFFKNSSSKYITRKSKKNQTLYYLQEWKGTNLLFIAKKEIPLNFFTVFIEEDLNFLLLIGLALLFLMLLLFALYAKLSLLSQAYSFLKTALVNYSETGSFPEDSSKNSFLSFYRNRQEVLNQITKQDSKLKEEDIQLQELLKQEIKKIKNKYPNLILHEDFQTDIKMFGFQRFFRTIFNELLLNAVESMGAMKEQKIDLSLKEENQHLVLSVRDYGVGLEETEKAFQIYYSTKFQLGVGLNLVQSIVTANQGQVELISQEEGGLSAIVRLPLSCFLKK